MNKTNFEKDNLATNKNMVEASLGRAELKKDNKNAFPKKLSEYSKTYALSDGTLKSVYSSNPINYYDEQNKKWKEINASLKEVGDEYVSELGKYKTRINKNSQFIGVTFGDENTNIEWQFLGTKENENMLKDKKRKYDMKVDNHKKDEFSYGKLKYLSCDDGVDIEYITQGNGLKENIVINKKSDEYKYFFNLKTKKLEVRIDEKQNNISFYSLKDGAEEIEFIIPTPYMFDAKKRFSDKVRYELRKTKENEYLFIVKADSKWINSAETVFPVTIDPQIVIQTDKDSSFFDISSTYTVSGKTYEFNQETYFPAGENGGYVYVTKLSFPYKQDANLNCKMIQAFLKLRVRSIPADGPILINKKPYTLTYANEELNIDIKDILLSVKETEKIEFTFAKDEESDNNGLVFFLKSGEYGPKLEIIYEVEGAIPRAEKTMDILGGESVIDLFSGEMVAKFDELNVHGVPFPVEIKHVFKKSDKDFFVGENFRLNINESLINVGDGDEGLSYVYEDESGKKHGFNKKYTYVNQNGELEIVDKKDLAIDLNGDIYYEDNEGKKYKVKEEQWSSCGLKVYGEKTGIKNVVFLEQRSDSLKNLQEKKLSYEETLKDFYVVSTYDASSVQSFEDLSVETFNSIVKAITKEIPDGNNAKRILLNKEGFLQYKALLFQYNALNNTLSTTGVLEGGTDYVKSAFLSSLYSIENVTKSAIDILNKYVENSSSGSEIVSVLNTLNHGGMVVESTINNLKNELNLENSEWLVLEDCIRQRNLLKRELSEQEDYLEEQIKSVSDQINLIIDNQAFLLEQFKEYYKQYLNILNDLDYLYYNEPVKILTDDTIFKFFNKYGNLVAITDKKENEVIFEYKHERINAIYVNESLQVSFEYENNLLQNITDMNGNKVSYSYYSGRLTQIIFPNLKTLNFSYDSSGHITNLISSDYLKETFTYNTDETSDYYGYLINYQLLSKNAETSHNNIGIGQNNYVNYSVILDEMLLGFDLGKAVITNKSGDKEYYLFGDYGVMQQYFEETNGLISKAERYTIVSVDEEKSNMQKYLN